MVMSKVVLALSALPAAFAAVAEMGKVAVLTESNFDDFLSENPDGALVEFYAPWCGHCKKLEPEYDAAAAMLKDDNVKTPLAKVDATVESALGSKFGVRGYPTLKYFVGGEPSDYDGPREKKGIVAWIKSMGGPAVLEEEPKETDDMYVALYGSEMDPAFEKLAKGNRKKATFYFVKGSDSKMVVKHNGEDVVESTDKDYETFFKANIMPMYGDLNGDTFKQYMDSGKGLIWILLPMTKETHKEVVAESRSWVSEVAAKVADKYSVAATNTAEFAKVLESMFSITEFPKVVVQKKAGDKKSFTYEGEMAAAPLLEYIADIESGKIQPKLKSEPIPEDQEKEPVKTFVGANLEETVFTKDKDVLLEIYAPWCGHCKKLEPEYVKVGKKVQKEGFEDIMVIAKMDGTQNDSPIDEITWSGFPTMYYIKAGDSKPAKYDGPREAKGIWKWIKQNHSKADYIKEKLAAKKKDDKKEEL